MKTITATAHLASDLRRRHDLQQLAEQRDAWSPAGVSHLQVWLNEFWTDWIYAGKAEELRLPLSQIEEFVWWERIIRSTDGLHLLDVSAAAESAASAWNLVCDWRIPLSRLRRQRDWSESSFANWAREFSELCTRKKRFARAELLAEVTGLIDQGLVPVPDAVEIAGFLELTPAQQRLFDVLGKRGTRIVKRPLPNANHSAVRLGLPDVDGEIRSAADWAREILESEPNADSPTFTIGIIVPDLKRLRGRIERVFGEVFHPSTRMLPEKAQRRLFDISLKPSICDYPIITAALDILQVDPKSIPIERASRLLRSPFMGYAESEMTRRARLDTKLRSRGDAHVTLGEIKILAGHESAAYSCPELKGLLGSWIEHHNKTKSRLRPSDWSEKLAKLLELTGWPGERKLSTNEYQIVREWGGILNELAGIDDIAGRVQRKRAVELVNRIASNRRFQPTSGLAPVQIHGIVEPAGLSFDHVWIMGMHDNAWPQMDGPNPLLPADLQRQRFLPSSTPDRELENAKRLTDCLKSCAGDIVVSHPMRESDSDLRVSPLFGDLEKVSAEDMGLIQSSTYLENLRQSGKLEKLDDHTGPPCSNSDQAGGTYLFKAQAACPFKAFAEVRLGASAPDWPDPGLSGMDRGQLVHNVLQEVWAELRTHENLCAKSQESLRNLVGSTVRSKIGKFAERSRARRGAQTEKVEQERLVELVLRWLDQEKTDRIPFEVVAQEETRNVELGGAETKVRIDRVDRLANGQLVFIDYKTGVCKTSDWQGERPDEPQLPIYASTSRDPVAGVFYGSLKADKVGFIGLADMQIVKGQSGGLADAKGAWKDALDRLGSEFMAGHAVVDPKRGADTCRYCALPSLCRIGTKEKSDG